MVKRRGLFSSERVLRKRIARIKRNIEFCAVKKVEIERKLGEFSQRYQDEKITYAEYQYLATHYLKGKSLEYWQQYYDSYQEEARRFLLQYEGELERKAAFSASVKRNYFPAVGLAAVLLLSVVFFTSLTGFFVQEPLSFDINGSWDLGNAFVRLSFNEFKEDIPALGLVVGDKIIVLLDGYNFTGPGTLYADLLVNGSLEASRSVVIEGPLPEVALPEGPLEVVINGSSFAENVSEPNLSSEGNAGPIPLFNESFANETLAAELPLENQTLAVINETSMGMKEKVRARERNAVLLDAFERDGKADLSYLVDGGEVLLRGVDTPLFEEIASSRQDSVRYQFKLVELSTAIVAAKAVVENATLILSKTGEVTDILRCDEWDFASEICLGEWEKSGLGFEQNESHVWFTVDSFSGYAGASLTILNVFSSPRQGDNWTVYFTTSGTANLIVAGVNETNFTEFKADDLYTQDELKFLEVWCGPALMNSFVMVNGSFGSLPYDSILDTDSLRGDSVWIEDYSCDNDTGRFVSNVLIPGYATLEFRFGDTVAYAIDPACTAAADNTTIGSDVTVCNTNPATGRDHYHLNDSLINGIFLSFGNQRYLDCNGSKINFSSAGVQGQGRGAQIGVGIINNTLYNCTFLNSGGFTTAGGIYAVGRNDNLTIKYVNITSNHSTGYGINISNSSRVLIDKTIVTLEGTTGSPILTSLGMIFFNLSNSNISKLGGATGVVVDIDS
ncbi:hypothetical protein HY501_02440, partial [Candidatus Woesearchaeota archaeon]|nr:hypothetical protein [Candidatus Woesearchaeota archaeon]